MKTCNRKNTLYILVILCSLVIIVVNTIDIRTSRQALITTNSSEVEAIKRADPLTDVIISSPTLKVGEVEKGTIIKHNFSIQNIGKQPLIIYEIIPDCTCTECSLSKKVIMPNDVTTISAVVDTKGRTGNFLVNIIVRANSKEGAHRFMITGHV